MMGNRTSQPNRHSDRWPVIRACTAAALAMLAVSCTRLPPLRVVDVPAGPGAAPECNAVFPTGRWRLVHAIETVISGRPAGTVVGVTIIAPEQRELEAIIMTLEGLVVFHARSAGNAIDVRRALAPFDSPHFAQGLIGDVTLLFLAPTAVKTMSGFSDETFTCRYVRGDASTVDVMPDPLGGWKMLEYDRRANLRRRVTANRQGDCLSTQGVRLPCQIDLEALQQPTYTLKMSLIEAETIAEDNR